MVQLIAFAAVAGVGIVAYNSFRKHWDAIQEEERRKEAAKNRPEDGNTLRKDPKTGRYRLGD